MYFTSVLTVTELYCTLTALFLRIDQLCKAYLRANDENREVIRTQIETVYKSFRILIQSNRLFHGAQGINLRKPPVCASDKRLYKVYKDVLARLDASGLTGVYS